MHGRTAIAGAETRYRADIDGLRAIAVLPVVAFHLGIPHLGGGFVGVDVFFVISGYLITGHLKTDIEARRFSVIRFYERRLRRIGPALLGMLLIVSMTALFYILPAELERYGESLLAALFSASNFYFWSQAGYFDAAASTKPLLHTWSLAVEEQYYLAFPILLSVLWKLGRRHRDAILLALLAASFALSAVTAYTDPSAAFYLPCSRAWELLLGAALALGIVRLPDHAAFRNAAVIVGLGMIALAVVRFDEGMAFPGIRALLPCLGAALVIAGGEHGQTAGGRLLSARPLVFIGLISYSLYLWHWPLITFTRLDNTLLPDHMPLIARNAAVFLGSIGLAALSWRTIETPFRSRTTVNTPLLVWTSAAAAAGVAVLAGLLVATNGLPFRYSPEVVRISNYLAYDNTPYTRKGVCFLTTGTMADLDRDACLGEGPGRNYLLIGDSHAAQYWYGLRTNMPGADFLQDDHAGCAPLNTPGKYATCNAYTKDLYGGPILAKGLDGIIVSARWSRTDMPRLAEAMDWWKAHHLRVTLIGPSPEYDVELPRLIVRAILRHDPDLPRRHLAPWIKDVDRSMARLAAREGVKYVSVYDRICAAGACRELAPGGVPMAFDNAHLTYAGSVVAVQAMLAHRDLP